jgi:hypothetical protein
VPPTSPRRPAVSATVVHCCGCWGRARAAAEHGARAAVHGALFHNVDGTSKWLSRRGAWSSARLRGRLGRNGSRSHEAEDCALQPITTTTITLVAAECAPPSLPHKVSGASVKGVCEALVQPAPRPASSPQLALVMDEYVSQWFCCLSDIAAVHQRHAEACTLQAAVPLLRPQHVVSVAADHTQRLT